MSRVEVSIPAEAHHLTAKWRHDKDASAEALTLHLTITCTGDGERPCPFDSCPYAAIAGQGMQEGFKVGWRLGWEAATGVASSKVAPAATSPVSVTFAPGAIQIEMPEREVHVTAPVTVQLPDRSRETLEIVRDSDGKMSRIRPIEVS